MRKILYILTLAIVLCSCSAQKQLARLLRNHPELHKDTVYLIDTCWLIKPDTNTINFTIDQLQELLNNAEAAALGDSTTNPTSPNSQAHPQLANSIQVENNHSLASITPNADGSFNLNVITKPDTIHIRDTIPIPVYYTDYKDKIVYKMNNAQTFFFGLGILLLVVIAIFVIIKAVKHFI